MTYCDRSYVYIIIVYYSACNRKKYDCSRIRARQIIIAVVVVAFSTIGQYAARILNMTTAAEARRRQSRSDLVFDSVNSHAFRYYLLYCHYYNDHYNYYY